MILVISSFEIISLVILVLNALFWIPASAADTVAVNPNGIKTLLTNALSLFFIKSETVFSDGPKSLTRNPPDCPILFYWFFDNYILADELFAKNLRSVETWVLVNNNLWGNLYLSLEIPITFHEKFKVTSVPFFIPDINFLSCELDNFPFLRQVFYWVILYWRRK